MNLDIKKSILSIFNDKNFIFKTIILSTVLYTLFQITELLNLSKYPVYLCIISYCIFIFLSCITIGYLSVFINNEINSNYPLLPEWKFNLLRNYLKIGFKVFIIYIIYSLITVAIFGLGTMFFGLFLSLEKYLIFYMQSHLNLFETGYYSKLFGIILSVLSHLNLFLMQLYFLFEIIFLSFCGVVFTISYCNYSDKFKFKDSFKFSKIFKIMSLYKWKIICLLTVLFFFYMTAFFIYFFLYEYLKWNLILNIIIVFFNLYLGTLIYLVCFNLFARMYKVYNSSSLTNQNI